MYDSVLIYSRHHASQQTASLFFSSRSGCRITHCFRVAKGVWAFRYVCWNAALDCHVASQRSLHYAPIFRLLLKVAVNGTHQCDFLIFCGAFMPQHTRASARKLSVLSFARSGRHSRLNRRRMGFRCLFGTEDLQVCLGNFEQSSGVNLPG